MTSYNSRTRLCPLNSKYFSSLLLTATALFSYRRGLTEDDLKDYSDPVKQAFSLENGSVGEIYSAKFYKLKDM